MRKAIGPDFPLMIKFGIQDDGPGGATLEEGLEAIKAMRQAGLDAIEISWGNDKLPGMKMVDGEIVEITPFRERAARAKREIDIPLALVCGIRTPETADDIVTSGDADFVSLCRPFIREPGLINRWMSGDFRKSGCTSCDKCHNDARRGDFLDCQEDKEDYEQ